LVFLGVHCDEWDEAVKVAESESIEYPLTNDTDGATQKAYDIGGYPTIYVIDKKGVVRYMDPPDLEEAVKELLAE
jgi:peroxiredoxin